MASGYEHMSPPRPACCREPGPMFPATTNKPQAKAPPSPDALFFAHYRSFWRISSLKRITCCSIHIQLQPWKWRWWHLSALHPAISAAYAPSSRTAPRPSPGYIRHSRPLPGSRYSLSGTPPRAFRCGPAGTQRNGSACRPVLRRRRPTSGTPKRRASRPPSAPGPPSRPHR